MTTNRPGMDIHLFYSRAILAIGLSLLACFVAPCAAAGEMHDTNGQTIGRVSGLPVPRFVSLKADRVNLREGPSRNNRAIWLYERAGLPVEITAEFGMWRKIRDSDGTEGWVIHNLLSGRRTAIVAPWKKSKIFTLYTRPASDAAPAARLQPGVIGNIRSCDGAWCEIYGDGFDGYIKQDDLWGVYPNEKIG